MGFIVKFGAMNDNSNSIIEITLPDGNKKEVNRGTKISEFVQSLSKSLSKSALAAKANDKLVDLSAPLNENTKLEILTYDSKDGKEVFYHSSAHLLGQAVQRLWPKALLTIGPVIEHGPGFFYYDVDFGEDVVTQEDLPKIEKEMEKIVKENLEVRREDWDVPKALEKFKEMGFEINVLC